ncbi:hypothetical protein [Cohnella algarum]|uniref:hypothetical protein n=1 Tax=Cohnella algarum TaxID=2044859 RepID=UPI001967E3AF|nr:hypothetical protein [Cohnella algarum]MBN2980087.1 hypothetical protein [Cohnella algarum]
MKATIMKRAHELAKGFEGHYAACLALALRQAWVEARTPAPAVEEVAEAIVSGLSLVRGCRKIDEAVIRTEAHSGWSKGWLARVSLSAPGARFDLEREFVRASADNTNRSGNGYKEYNLSQLVDGIYEADSVAKSYQSHRTFFQVAGGSVVEIFEDKAAAKAALGAGKYAA